MLRFMLSLIDWTWLRKTVYLPNYLTSTGRFGRQSDNKLMILPPSLRARHSKLLTAQYLNAASVFLVCVCKIHFINDVYGVVASCINRFRSCKVGSPEKKKQHRSLSSLPCPINPKTFQIFGSEFLTRMLADHLAFCFKSPGTNLSKWFFFCLLLVQSMVKDDPASCWATIARTNIRLAS